MFLLLLACTAAPSGEGPPSWALQYASVSPGADGAWRGHSVWTFYEAGWSQEPGAEWHLCSLLQVLEGVPDPSIEGCPECEEKVLVSVRNLETDCEPAWVEDESFTATSAMGIGPGDPEMADRAPHSSSMGWYQAYGDEELAFQGHATSEDAELGREAPEGWSAEAWYTLWPTYAWSL